MAERRMFTKKVTDDDNFMNLSASAQALYLHLSMSADDDGFCNQIVISMFKAHASVQDLQALLEKRYIYQFENGVIVIKHWRMANALRKDRYTPTAFQKEFAQLRIKDNGSYTWLPSGCQEVAKCLPQDGIGKDSIGKDSISKAKFTPPSHDEARDYYASKNYVFGFEAWWHYYNDAEKPWTKGDGTPVKDWKRTMVTWQNHDDQREKNEKSNRHNYQGREYSDEFLDSLYTKLDDEGEDTNE